MDAGCSGTPVYLLISVAEDDLPSGSEFSEFCGLCRLLWNLPSAMDYAGTLIAFCGWEASLERMDLLLKGGHARYLWPFPRGISSSSIWFDSYKGAVTSWAWSCLGTCRRLE